MFLVLFQFWQIGCVFIHNKNWKRVKELLKIIKEPLWCGIDPRTTLFIVEQHTTVPRWLMKRQYNKYINHCPRKLPRFLTENALPKRSPLPFGFLTLELRSKASCIFISYIFPLGFAIAQLVVRIAVLFLCWSSKMISEQIMNCFPWFWLRFAYIIILLWLLI